jgi:hypothetical protein
LTKNQDIFFSLGLEDNTLIEWRSKHINHIFHQKLVENLHEYFDDPSYINSDQTKISDQCLIRELEYCFYSSGVSDKIKDQFTLFRGANQKILNSCKFSSIQSFDDVKQFFAKRAPPLSLHLEYIYGFQAFKFDNFFPLNFFFRLIEKENLYIMFIPIRKNQKIQLKNIKETRN